MAQTYTYLALGDSYTIGEGVALTAGFPAQAVQRLRNIGHAFTAPEIVATTGWTTDELLEGMRGYAFLPAYDFVSLLIGVNDQYRNRPVADYIPSFTQLLQMAINFTGGDTRRVVVLSIPDWGVTPFAAAGDRQAIAAAIDAYNAANAAVALEYGVHYADITSIQRLHGHESAWLAADGLHPSASAYATWADVLTAIIQKVIHT